MNNWEVHRGSEPISFYRTRDMAQRSIDRLERLGRDVSDYSIHKVSVKRFEMQQYIADFEERRRNARKLL